jgi:hypothetical protein
VEQQERDNRECGRHHPAVLADPAQRKRVIHGCDKQKRSNDSKYESGSSTAPSWESVAILAHAPRIAHVRIDRFWPGRAKAELKLTTVNQPSKAVQREKF